MTPLITASRSFSTLKGAKPLRVRNQKPSPAILPRKDGWIRGKQ